MIIVFFSNDYFLSEWLTLLPKSFPVVPKSPRRARFKVFLSNDSISAFIGEFLHFNAAGKNRDDFERPFQFRKTCSRERNCQDVSPICYAEYENRLPDDEINPEMHVGQIRLHD